MAFGRVGTVEVGDVVVTNIAEPVRRCVLDRWKEEERKRGAGQEHGREGLGKDLPMDFALVFE